MSRSRAFLTAALAILAWATPYAAIAQQDRPYVSLEFARQNDFTFTTQFDTWYGLQKGRYSLDLRLAHTNIYNTSEATQPFVQLYLRSSIWQRWQLRPRLDIVSWIETDQYFNSRNEKVNLYGGVRYRPLEGIAITPMLGYTFDVRTAVIGQSSASPRLDQGLTPALLFTATHDWPALDLSTQTELFTRYKDISPRRQYNLGLKHFWAKVFQEGVQLRAGLLAGSHELDDYQGSSVKRILSDTIQPVIDIAYQFEGGFEWRSENHFQIFRRRFMFTGLEGAPPAGNDLVFNGMEVRTMQRVALIRPRWRTSAGYEYLFNTRVYDLENTTGMTDAQYESAQAIEQQKDFLKDFHRIDLRGDFNLGKRQMLSANYVNQYVQYDTQSETNFDDRDELSHLGNIEWLGRWRKDFHTTVSFSGNYRHYAFLLSEKSQDNYIQRSLRTDFKFGWDPSPKVRIDGDNAVYVTYNVKDFTDYNKTDRSTRNLETNLRTYYRPSKRLQVETTFRRKETQQSYLDWEAFTETTVDTNTIMTIEHKYKYQWQGRNRANAWFVEAGYKHFDQTKRFKATMIGLDNATGPVSLRQVSLQTGPVLNLGLRRRDQSSIDLGVWLQAQIRRNRYERLQDGSFYPGIFREEELNTPSLSLRPYMNIRLNYFLGKAV